MARDNLVDLRIIAGSLPNKIQILRGRWEDSDRLFFNVVGQLSETVESALRGLVTWTPVSWGYGDLESDLRSSLGPGDKVRSLTVEFYYDGPESGPKLGYEELDVVPFCDAVAAALSGRTTHPLRVFLYWGDRLPLRLLVDLESGLYRRFGGTAVFVEQAPRWIPPSY